MNNNEASHFPPAPLILDLNYDAGSRGYQEIIKALSGGKGMRQRPWRRRLFICLNVGDGRNVTIF
jgi:hypothetical protein